MLTRHPDSAANDAALLLAEALRRVRITDSMQYCFMPAGDWETDATPASYKPKDAIGFHILVGGTCWVEIGGQRTMLREGDIAAFPFGTPHRIGAGASGPEIDPSRDLPPSPWSATPVLRYGDDSRQVRMLCGYVRCEAMNFGPFRRALPEFIHVPTGSDGDWLGGILAQIEQEVDAAAGGGTAVLERLTELALLEVLRRQLRRGADQDAGWLAAIHDPLVGRCLQRIHAEPVRQWTLETLSREVGASRSVVSGRFAAALGVAPIRYLRDWRLFLASERLAHSDVAIGSLAAEAGYGTESAFNRAFTRSRGLPPAAYRAMRNRPAGS